MPLRVQAFSIRRRGTNESASVIGTITTLLNNFASGGFKATSRPRGEAAAVALEL